MKKVYLIAASDSKYRAHFPFANNILSRTVTIRSRYITTRVPSC